MRNRGPFDDVFMNFDDCPLLKLRDSPSGREAWGRDRPLSTKLPSMPAMASLEGEVVAGWGTGMVCGEERSGRKLEMKYLVLVPLYYPSPCLSLSTKRLLHSMQSSIFYSYANQISGTRRKTTSAVVIISPPGIEKERKSREGEEQKRTPFFSPSSLLRKNPEGKKKALGFKWF